MARRCWHCHRPILCPDSSEYVGEFRIYSPWAEYFGPPEADHGYLISKCQQCGKRQRRRGLDESSGVICALTGTGNIRAEDVTVLEGKKVYLLLDPDTNHDLVATDPGAAHGARAAITALQTVGAHVYLVPQLAEGADLNETMVDLGAQEFAEFLTACIRAAQPLPAPRPPLDLSPTLRRWL